MRLPSHARNDRVAVKTAAKIHTTKILAIDNNDQPY